ncbi:uncharacterized protein [Amphiura filiformis]|uniref:uncharacterized protein n=1 Tax=Amphiura filiformis TaxID=82378 RepID=UPI003B224D7A
MEETATDKYSRFIAANKEAAEKIIPAKKRSRRANFSRDPRVIKARDHIRETYEVYQLDITDCNREEYKKAKENLDDAYNKVIEADLSGKLREVERAHVNSKHGESWKLINDITGRKACSTGQLKGNTQSERVTNWYNHFKGLLGSPPDIDDEEEEITPILDELDIKVGPFDKEEYEEAKASLVEGKSCGEDNIPPEVLKRCNLDDIVLGFCNDALIKGKKPDQWSILNIVPILKTGDLSSGNNYRGISLSSIVAKTYNRMILNRIRPEIDQHLRTNQNGFRVGRTTVGHILALRRLIEEVKAHNLPAIITFIDFKKAFDTIHRGKMLKILHAYGIPELIVEAIGKMYQNTKAKVISPDGETDLFEILAGVLQGDTLAPYLFVIVLDFALRIAIEGNEEELGFHLEKRRNSPLLGSHGTSNNTKKPASSRWITVEPVIVIMVAAVTPINTLVEPKYIENRVAQNLNYSLEDDNAINGTCKYQNSSNPDYLQRQQVADETAYWLMISTAIIYVPALFVAPFYGALSDRIGRKVNLLAPIVPNILKLILQLIVMYNNLSIAVYAYSNIISGFGGGYCFFLAGCYAYIADVSSGKSRIVRMSVVVAVANITASVAPLLYGYIIDVYGSSSYIPIMWSAIALQVVGIVYTLIYLPEPNRQKSMSILKLHFLTDTLQEVFKLLKVNVHKRRIRLSLLLIIYFLTDLVQLSSGASKVFTIYGLGPPFCWSAVTLSYFNLTYYIMGAVGMLLGGKLFSMCLQEYWILQIAYTFGMIQYVIAAIAPSTAIFFLAPVIGGLRGMDGPVIYTILSELVTPGERGVVFAVESSVQSFANLLSPLIWNPIYSATLDTHPSFVFYVMGCVYIILMLMSWIWFTFSNKVLLEDIKRRRHSDELVERSQETED